MLALAGCGAALQAEDSQTQDLVRRARESYGAKQYEQAETAAGEALKRAADNPQALYLRGLARVARKQYALGRDDLEAAQKADPMLLFTSGNKAEFENALRIARENTMTALDGAKPSPGKSDKPASPTAAKPAPAKLVATGDPMLDAVKRAGTVLQDLSGSEPTKLGPDQLKVLRDAVQPFERKQVAVKLLVAKAGVDPVKEAQRLHLAATQGPATVVVVASADGKIGLYHPAVTASEANDLVAKATAENSKESLARKLVATLGLLAPKVQAPPAVPEAKPLPPTAPVGPTAPMPVPAGPAPWMYGVAGLGAVLALVVLAKLIGRLRAGQRLARGFQAARPQLDAVAQGLGAVATGLRAKRDRGAEVAQQAAELAYFDALAMMAQASEGEVADTARVERAVRLLDEAQAKVAEAQASLASAADRPSPRPGYCFFTARLLPDARDADRVDLRRGDVRLTVLASREAGEVLRRGGVPTVRVVNGRHWSQCAEFVPETDFYSDRCGRAFVPVTELAWTFTGEEPLFVPSEGRPDYKIDLSSPA
ncbi:MAG: hypothetical protein HZB16_13020 [Armatimonadetes bacterium]|nr:hypothetical protein [Armatimonadota bacterium]